MRNKIYYLLDFHLKCVEFSNYGDKIRQYFCKYVNNELNKFFLEEEQKKLGMFNFDENKLTEFSYGYLERILFDGLDEEKLCQLFENISFVSEKDLRYLR